MRYGVKRVNSGIKRLWRVFLPGMAFPTYHTKREEAMMAARLRGVTCK